MVIPDGFAQFQGLLIYERANFISHLSIGLYVCYIYRLIVKILSLIDYLQVYQSICNYSFLLYIIGWYGYIFLDYADF